MSERQQRPPLFRPEAVRALSGSRPATPIAAVPPGINRFFAGLALMVGIAVPALAMIDIPRIVPMEGTVVPSRGAVEVSPPQAGVIEALHALEGGRIQRGERLFTVAPNESRQQQRQRRESIRRSSERAANLGERIMHLEARIEALARLGDSRVQAAELEREAARVGLQSRQQELAEIEEDIVRIRRLAEAGAVPGERLWKLERRHARTAARLARDKVDLSLQGGQIETARRRSQIDLIDARRTLARLRDEQAAAQAEVGRLEDERRHVVSSPVTGMVASVSVSRGQPIGPRDTVAVLIPDGSEPRFRLHVTSEKLTRYEPPRQGAGHPHPIDSVAGSTPTLDIEIAAYPHDVYGTIPADITSVTGGALAEDAIPTSADNARDVFRIEARPAPSMADLGERGIHLLPGMSVSVHFIAEERSALMWIFHPLLDNWNK